MTRVDVLAELGARLGRDATIRHDHVRLLEPRDAAEAAHAPLRVVGDDHDALGRRQVRLIGLALEQVRGGEAGIDGHPVHPHEEDVDVQRAQRRDGERADERVRWRAHTSGQDHRQVRPPLGVQHVRDLQRVGDDGQAGDVEEVVCEQPGGGTRRQADRLPRLDQRARGACDRLLLLDLLVRLGLEAGLVGAHPARSRRTSVHLVHEPGGREHVEIAAHRHVGHAEQLRQLADARGARAEDFLEDQLLTLLGEHLDPSTITHRPEHGHTAVGTR